MSRTPNIDAQIIADLLTVACGLLEIEARDHRDNYSPSPLQRKNVAKTLSRFTAKARSALDQGTSPAAHGNQAEQAPAVEAKGA